MNAKNAVYIASYGAGVNSTAMILLLLKKNRPIDKILFADTGAEFPETYEYLRIFGYSIHTYQQITECA